jgi:2-hydroxy-6-oxonona-2,4-dienedioate hydrolase
LRIRLEEVDVGARRAKVWMGGSGETLLLLHGAWGGAEMHWAAVWEPLAERFCVVAPELPGVGDPASSGLASFDAYADWLADLLAALGVQSAWCVGNSFGGMLAWQLTARLVPRCRGVILVNGAPPPEMPALVRGLAAIAPVTRLFRALYRKLNFSPAVLARAYADPARAPAQLVRVLAQAPPAYLDLLLGILLAGTRPAPRPDVPVLLAWGESDRLPGTAGAGAARRLQRAIPGAKLALIPSAGHCPQMERPTEFVDAIVSFIAPNCDKADPHCLALS